MNRRILAQVVAVLAIVLSVASCQNPNQQPPDILSSKPAVELRAMQTRAFDTTDRNKTIRAVIATLQDLGYTIDKVEPPAGTVSANKLSILRLTATVYPRGDTQMTVRANALVKVVSRNNQVDDPLFYQQRFFEPLSKAMFLSALQVEDKADSPAMNPTKAGSGTGGGSESTAASTSANTSTQGN